MRRRGCRAELPRRPRPGPSAMAHRAAPAPALPGDDDRLGSLADRCNPQSILARTSTIRRLKLAQGWTVFEIPSTRSALETPRPSPVVASRPLRWLSVARRSATPPPRRGGFSLSLVGCCPRAPRRTSPSPAGEVSSHPPSVRRGSAALLLRAVRGSPERRSRKQHPRDARHGRRLGPDRPSCTHCCRGANAARARKRRPWPHDTSCARRAVVALWARGCCNLQAFDAVALWRASRSGAAQLRSSAARRRLLRLPRASRSAPALDEGLRFGPSASRRSGPHIFHPTARKGPGGGRYLKYRPPPVGIPDADHPAWPVVAAAPPPPLSAWLAGGTRTPRRAVEEEASAFLPPPARSQRPGPASASSSSSGSWPRAPRDALQPAGRPRS